MRVVRYNQILLLLSVTLLTWQCKKHSANSPEQHSTNTQDTAIFVQAKPFTGVCIGNSIIAGFPWHRSGLELGIPDLPDTFGQISYRLTQLSRFDWIDRGWTGQTTVQIRARFLRDAIGDSSDPGDGLGPVTLKQRPDYVVMEGGVNDFRDGIPLDTVETNLAWMVSTCKLNHIRCIVLNCIGEGNNVFDQAQIDSVTALNSWLAGGVLDSTGAILVDINSLWNSGIYGGVSSYGNDNIHYSSLVWSGDGIHFTPAGYNAVAAAIFQVARLGGTSKFVP